MSARRTTIGALLLAPVICIATSSTSCGAEAIDDLSWFDAASGTLRRPGKSPLAPAAANLSEPKSPRDWTWEPPDFSNNRGWGFSRFGEVVAQGLQIAAWVLIGLAALWFVLFVLRSYRDLELGKKPDSDKRSFDRAVDVEKLADLPFDAPQAGPDLLSTIRAMYEQGQYGNAIVLLFGYQLLKLDKSQLIRVLKGKTNRQYVRELGRHDDQSRLRDMLAQTMVTFEDYFFGNHPVTREKFESCWGQLDEFHSIVEAAP